ncbi:TetR/AcrR family transcriptional regulator [Catenovulum sediminis]|uniref:TetR/AcrR family transcriptional regulator n=1 Tax=Catenovulum sediminis TaxID=1740262 RepID=A0ABV1RBQ7_9ALTE|nr:TetR/AcrR family transcriptional regulator [Catenovulum sediminis]
MGFWLKHLKQKRNKFCPLVRCSGGKGKAEKIAEREYELIQIAHQLVDELGFTNLTMDKLVSASPYSKGTIYNHFNCKEDVFAALGVHSMGLCSELMIKAANFNGNSRERGLAMHFAYRLYSQLEPALFMCAISTKTSTVGEKASAQRLTQLDESDKKIALLCDQVFDDAIKDGSLNIDPLLIPKYSFANWSFSFGTNLLLQNAADSFAITRLNLDNSVLFNINILFDGMGWLPLSGEFDYVKSWQKLEVYFSDYLAMLKN